MAHRQRTHNGQPPPAAETAAYLDGLSVLAGRSFPSTAELLGAVLKLVVEQLGLRTSYVTEIACQDGQSVVLAAYNAPGGCDVREGAVLVLTDTF